MAAPLTAEERLERQTSAVWRERTGTVSGNCKVKCSTVLAADWVGWSSPSEPFETLRSANKRIVEITPQQQGDRRPYCTARSCRTKQIFIVFGAAERRLRSSTSTAARRASRRWLICFCHITIVSVEAPRRIPRRDGPSWRGLSPKTTRRRWR